MSSRRIFFSSTFLVIYVVYFTYAVSFREDVSLTLREKITLNKFKERVSPLLINAKGYLKTEFYLIRFLRARKFDINSAEKMLRKSLKWRKENHMDTVLDEDWSDLFREFPVTMDTYDKEGRPVGNLEIGQWDIRRATLRPKHYRMRVMRFLYHLPENITMQVYERQLKGMNVTQWSLLASADGLNIVQHMCAACLPYWIQFVQAIEDNYNGWMDKYIIVDNLINETLPDNVMLTEWAPQQTILAHPKIKAFISHCGMGSMTEAVHFGVPLVVLPVLSEQDSNANFIDARGAGIRLEILTLKKHELENAISEILNNKRYRDTMKGLSDAFKDRPSSPIENAVWWIEYILRHESSNDYLVPLSIRQPWWKRRQIDVWLALGAFTLLVLSISLCVLFKLTKKLLEVLSGTNKSSAHGKKLKSN